MHHTYQIIALMVVSIVTYHLKISILQEKINSEEIKKRSHRTSKYGAWRLALETGEDQSIIQ